MQEDEPIRVLHTIGQLMPGGVERRTLELIQNTSKENFQHVVCVTSGKRGSLDDEFRRAGAQIYYINVRSPLFPFKFFSLLKSQSIATIHAMLMYTSGYLVTLARLAGVQNRIVQFRSDGQEDKGTPLRRAQKRILHFLIDTSATQIVGLTPRNLEIAWSSSWREDPRCSVIPNGVLPHQVTSDIPEEIVRHASKTLILHIGRGDLVTKNREKAISAFAEYTRTNPNAVLLFLGRDGRTPIRASENRERWEKLTRQYGVSDRVYFLGEKKSVFPYLSVADLFLFTSTLEGLPGVVLEALSAGVPVVSSNVPGSVFIADHHPGVQILEPTDPDDKWAEVMGRHERKLTARSRNKIRKLFNETIFNFDRAASRYLGLWRDTP